MVSKADMSEELLGYGEKILEFLFIFYLVFLRFLFLHAFDVSITCVYYMNSNQRSIRNIYA